MNSSESSAFFENISRSVKISHFIASIIPLALLVYFSIRYVYPYVTEGDVSKMPVSIGILLFLAVVVSVLGLILTTKATNSSIESARTLNLKLNSLIGISKQFKETLYLDILIEKIMGSAIELTNAESGSLFLYDDKGKLESKVNSGDSELKMDKHVTVPGRGIAGWVAECSGTALINNVSEDPRYDPEFDNRTGVRTKSVLCVPLIYMNATIGVIELRNKKNGDFTKQDEALIQSLAAQASISITQKKTSETQQSDLIHITEMLVNAQDYIQKKKGHARRVAGYANMIGKKMNFPDTELKKLYYASLLHDIGMLRIDVKDQHEKEKVMQHPKLGSDLIRSISLWGDSADIILHHHERYDGTGYPTAKAEEEIPLSSRILHAADTFDKLTSSYSNEKSMDYASAVCEIEANSGSQFDPAVVNALKSSLAEAGLISE